MKKFLAFIISALVTCTCAFGLTACGVDGKDGVDGTNGKDGVSVETVYFDDDGNMIVKLTDGKEINCGPVVSAPYENFYFTEVKEEGKTVSYTVRAIGAVSDADIVIPATYKGKPVTAIGESAFFNCKYITSVTLPDSVKTIGDYAFNGCENLKTVDLGNGVETIGMGAFAYCYSLEGVEFPSSVRTINADAFCGCLNLRTAVFAEGVERVSRSVFSGCGMLEEVILPDSIVGGADGEDYSMFALFMNCSSLKRVKLPASLEFVPQHMFSGCYSLEEVELGKSVKKIGYSAFYNNGMLKSLILPASLKECERYAFYRLPSLESVYFEGSAEQWAEVKVVRAESGGDGDHFGYGYNSALRANDGGTTLNVFEDTVTIYFYSETAPTSEGNFWHYAADGKTPTVW